MLCSNIDHNFSWAVNGSVTPCNQLHGFPRSVTIEEMRNTNEYQQLTQSNADNAWTKYCVRCQDKEDIGLSSKRQVDNQLHKVYSLLNSSYIKIDGAIGAICNAGCRICGAHSSTFWQQEDRKFNNEIKIANNTTNFWEQVWKHRDTVLQLDLGGGEPWVNNIDQQEKIFDYWIETNRACLIKIRYNTNGSLYPKLLLEKLTKFREVRITLSIDDIEERFEYNRYPLKWESIIETVKKLTELEKKCSNIVLDINYTVSVFTFLYAHKFEQYAKNVLQVDKINFNILETPNHYSIKSLPVDIKQHVSADNMFYDLIGKTPMENWELTFTEITSNIDKRRKQSFAEIFQELNYILRINHGKTI
jgi:hypothetical protein